MCIRDSLRTDPELFGAAIDRDPSLSHQLMLDVASVYACDVTLDDPAISPALGTMDDLPPTIITTGTYDLLMEQSLRVAQKIGAAGIDTACNVWPGLWHVFEFYDELPEAERSLRDIADFLGQY